MPYAAVGDTGYNLILLLHILSAMVAVAPAFIHPFVERQSRGAADRGRTLGYLANNSRRIHAPALIVTGILGFGAAGMSKIPGTDELAWKMSQGWLVTAFIVWVAMNGVLHAIILPAEKALAGGDEGAFKKVNLGGGIFSVLFVVMLYTMIFKPGL
ncbi:MAG: hypothetical protein P8N02_07305 [Actinomycetota bacterium]|jgi:hypothetical protein|nr:hypothetical protein [Actinomycetota bacterium]